MKEEEGGEQKGRQSQDKEEESAPDGVCLSILRRTAALNRALAEADQLCVYTKEGSQQRDVQVEQMPRGRGEYELTWM